MQHAAVIPLPWRDPLDAAAPFADEPWTLLLLSGGPGEAGRWSYLLRAPERTVMVEPSDVDDPFDAVAALLGPPTETREDGPPFQGGVAGLAAYELGDRIEPLGLPRHPDWPDLATGLYPALLAFDAERERVLAIGRGFDAATAQARARAAAGWLDAPTPKPPQLTLAEGLQPEPPERYEAAVADVVARIGAGEIFQANIARAWRGRLAPEARPFDVVRRLAQASPAPFAAYLRLPGRALVSNSPERFLRVERRGALIAETRPIKGTRPRGADLDEDARLAAELVASAKDRAENLMIVDLMRNDLSRVCAPGAVETPELFRLESFANVHHLVSTVRGRLAPGRTALDLLRAAFPPGSVTGAPKVQAMKVIDAHEPPRGPYCGSLFWAGVDGAFDSSVLIRTAAFAEDDAGWRVEARAGAGITADSDPLQERLETEAKIGALRRALEAAA